MSKVKLKKDWPFVVRFSFNEFASVKINAGEIGEYFSHGDCYCFESREGITPWISRGVLESLPEWFQDIQNNCNGNCHPRLNSCAECDL